MKDYILMLTVIIAAVTVKAQQISQPFSDLINYVSPQDFDSPPSLGYGDIAGINQGTQLIQHQSYTDKLGQQHTKYHQYYQGLRVLGGTAIFHSRQGELYATSGTLAQVGNVSLRSSIGESSARAIAEQHIVSHPHHGHSCHIEHHHQDVKITPEVVGFRKAIADRQYPLHSGEYTLDYIYTVEASNLNIPFSMDVHVNAHTGEIITAITNIEGVTIEGRGSGLYHEDITFNVDSVAPNRYVLRDLTRGDGIYAFDIAQEYAEITDTDNVWEYQFDGEKGVLDGYYAAIKYYDFLLEKFDRNSIDGNGTALTLNLNRNLYVNAFWNGSEATFGNGDCNRYYPLTTFEIVSHEFTHGLTDYTSDLVYAYESGALNEAMSDIFGKGLEYFYDNDNFNWYIGQALGRTASQQPFRSMVDPTERFDPKYYRGEHWVTSDSDNGGVHSNSGVLNHWFYLLVEGGSGTNEAGESYSISGIGMEDGLQIAYHMQAAYLTELSGYVDARKFGEASAIDLYGEGSPQHTTVVAAWDAVGVPTTAIPSGNETIAIGVGFEGRVGGGELYCPSDFESLQLDIYNRDTDITLPVGTIITGTAELQYDGSNGLVTRVVDLPITTLTEMLFSGSSITYDIVEPLQGDPASVLVQVDLAITTPEQTVYDFATSTLVTFSTIQVVEVDYADVRHRDICSEFFGGIDFEYFILQVPICTDLTGAVLVAEYIGEVGTVTYEEPVTSEQGSTLFFFNPNQNIDISEAGPISSIDFKLIYQVAGDQIVLHEESYNKSYASLITEAKTYTFDDAELVQRELAIAGCPTCEVTYGDGALVMDDPFQISGIEDCMSPKQYFDAVTNSPWTPASTAKLCVDLTDMTDPGLVFDIMQADNADYTAAENEYIHITDIMVGGSSILTEPISTTGNTSIPVQVPLPADYIGEIELVVINQSTTTTFDNLGIREGVISSSKTELSYGISYNNPVQDIFYIYDRNGAVVGGTGTINFYSVRGELVRSQQLAPSTDIGALDAGIYFFEVQLSDGTSYRGKVIKVN